MNSVADGALALKAAEHLRPDLVLLDLMLPGIRWLRDYGEVALARRFRVSVGGAKVRLRLKEFQLLVALAERPGELATRQILADEVWGYDHLPSSRTIDVHIRRLRQAVEEVSAFLFIHTVHGMGYRRVVEQVKACDD